MMTVHKHFLGIILFGLTLLFYSCGSDKLKDIPCELTPDQSQTTSDDLEITASAEETENLVNPNPLIIPEGYDIDPSYLEGEENEFEEDI